MTPRLVTMSRHGISAKSALSVGSGEHLLFADKGLVHHSDRGSQYASADYQAMLKQHGIVCSMSRKGDCWDNAPMESFFGTLKTESLHRYKFKTRNDARREIFEYIEIFYNRKRIHSALDFISPEAFEAQVAKAA